MCEKIKMQIFAVNNELISFEMLLINGFTELNKNGQKYNNIALFEDFS